MLARRFLWIIAVVVVLLALAALGWRLAGPKLVVTALKPTVTFAQALKPGEPDYAKTASWISRPGMADEPARWTPVGIAPAPAPGAYAFFIAPTADLDRERWNTPIDDATVNGRLDLFARGQASVFNGVAAVWMPRYRQATVGAFLVQRGPEATRAFDLAYTDVTRAFDAFLAAVPPDAPIILAGHSQGAMHLIRLLRERVAGKPLSRRLVAAYVVGWPVSLEHDLPMLGLPTCGPGTAGCLASWQTWAADGDPAQLTELYAASAGLDGKPRGGSAMLCVDPLTGQAGGEGAPAVANMGTLVPTGDFSGAELRPKLVGARCDAQGLLRLNGKAPAELGDYVLPGGNYHVYDYALFWANIRADVESRLAAYAARVARTGAMPESEG